MVKRNGIQPIDLPLFWRELSRNSKLPWFPNHSFAYFHWVFHITKPLKTRSELRVETFFYLIISRFCIFFNPCWPVEVPRKNVICSFFSRCLSKASGFELGVLNLGITVRSRKCALGFLDLYYRPLDANLRQPIGKSPLKSSHNTLKPLTSAYL